jgi:hypothetical protein
MHNGGRLSAGDNDEIMTLKPLAQGPMAISTPGTADATLGKKPDPVTEKGQREPGAAPRI